MATKANAAPSVVATRTTATASPTTELAYIRRRPELRDHVWSYDFVEAQTCDSRKLRLMTLIDEFASECLAIRVVRRINRFGMRQKDT